MAIVWVGSVVQLAAPAADVSYVHENGELVGALGTFSTTWYIGKIAFYTGLLVAAIGFLGYALSGGSRANDA